MNKRTVSLILALVSSSMLSSCIWQPFIQTFTRDEYPGNRPPMVIADKDGNIPSVRLAIQGHNVNNANGWVETGSFTPSATLAVESGKYALGQCRTEEAVGFDTYKFADLPGSENETVAVNNLSLKMSTYGDGKFMTTLTRIDAPYAVTLPDPRNAVVGFFKIG